ncbi:MAG TPA: subclass B3 metallo-beta-lactamase [Pseudomonadota bacterium]|nr:subclass B3 metallo-beta-lactamase [Pseudomonadota bacterium]
MDTTTPDALPADLKPFVCDSCNDWNAARAPFKLFGASHYVGPEGLSVVAIDTGKGVILIDGALPQSVDGIIAGLKSIGRDVRDVKYIAVSHPHFDHAGGVAALSRSSGATVLSTAAGADALKQGNVPTNDPQAGYGDFMKFPPVANLRALADGESLTLGDITLTAHATPGHAPGGTSWSWRDCEGERCLDLVFADSLNPVSHDDFHFGEGNRAAIFRSSIAKVRGLPCDLLVSAHPSQSQLFERVDRGEVIDPEACKAYADDAEQRLTERLGEERAADPATTGLR